MQLFLYSNKNGSLQKSKRFTYKNFLYNITNLSRKNFSSVSQNVLYNPDLDYYNILKISSTSNISEIKKAFYSLSIKHHPDKGGNENEFKIINNAYEVLKSSEDRKIYDKLRQAYKEDLQSRIQDKHRTKEKNQNEKQYDNYHYRKQDREFNKDQAEWAKKYHDHEYYKNSYKAGYQNYNSYDYAYKNYESAENLKNHSESDPELNKQYKEFLEIMIKYYKVKFNKNSSSENFSENNFHKFKYNIKYTPPEKEKQFSDFILNSNNKLFKENRIKSYQEQLKRSKKKREVNPFEIYNEINLDSEFSKSLNKINNNYESEKRLTLNDFKRVYNPKIFYGFLSFNICIALYLIYSI